MQDMNGYLQHCEELIAKSGWMVQSVIGQPPFGYTVGLSRRGLPELVMVGLPPKTAHTILNAIARRLVDGACTIEDGKLDHEVLQGFPAIYRKVPPAAVQDHLRVLIALSPAEQPPEVFQVVWPDQMGNFPGDAAADPQMVACQDLALAAMADTRPS